MAPLDALSSLARAAGMSVDFPACGDYFLPETRRGEHVFRILDLVAGHTGYDGPGRSSRILAPALGNRQVAQHHRYECTEYSKISSHTTAPALRNLCV
jgi:hypothetical protein